MSPGGTRASGRRSRPGGIAALLAGLLLLAACDTGTPPDFAPADAPLPPEVVRGLPPDIPGDQVFVDSRHCYWYRQFGQMSPIMYPDDPSHQFCLG